MTLVKYKKRPTVDLLCIGTAKGEEGKQYEHAIGSLILQDSKGRTVNVSSGLSKELRFKDPDTFIGKVIEIEYEQIIDTYIQPAFICIREKNPEDID